MIMRNTFYILLALVTLFLQKVSGEENSSYYFTHINGDNGLSSSNVKAIIQDSYGFMWFGTKNGLNRFDGTSILRMNCEDHQLKKGNNNISALYEDANRTLWVGTDRGVYLYHPASDVFTHINQKTKEGKTMDNWVSAIVGDTQGNIWVIIPIREYSVIKTTNYIFMKSAIGDNLSRNLPIVFVSVKMGKSGLASGD